MKQSFTIIEKISSTKFVVWARLWGCHPSSPPFPSQVHGIPVAMTPLVQPPLWSDTRHGSNNKSQPSTTESIVITPDYSPLVMDLGHINQPKHYYSTNFNRMSKLLIIQTTSQCCSLVSSWLPWWDLPVNFSFLWPSKTFLTLMSSIPQWIKLFIDCTYD